MKRRTLFKSLAGLVALKTTEGITAEVDDLRRLGIIQSPLPEVKLKPSPFAHLTIDHFGAKNTKISRR